MIRPFMPTWLKSERVEFFLECVGTFLLSGAITHWLTVNL